MPQRLPDRARVANIFFENHQHLAKGAGQHVDVSNGGFFALFARQHCVEHRQRAHRVLGGDGIGKLVERPLLGREHHSLHVADRDSLLLPNEQNQLFQFVAHQHHVSAQRVYQLACGVSIHLYRVLGGMLDYPVHSIAFFHARQFNDRAILS